MPVSSAPDLTTEALMQAKVKPIFDMESRNPGRPPKGLRRRGAVYSEKC
jgi:hypothetical protein